MVDYHRKAELLEHLGMAARRYQRNIDETNALIAAETQRRDNRTDEERLANLRETRDAWEGKLVSINEIIADLGGK